jgi:hypothetical protein
MSNRHKNRSEVEEEFTVLANASGFNEMPAQTSSGAAANRRQLAVF